jgi:hypothetical protein
VEKSATVFAATAGSGWYVAPCLKVPWIVSARVLICATLSASTCCLKNV